MQSTYSTLQSGPSTAGPFAASASRPLLQLHRVTKLYGTVIGVNDVTFELQSGAYGLLGPNGSGKSTLINLITGQLKPTLGHLKVLGETPWNNNPLMSRIGICPQLETLYSNVSGLDWVIYLLRLNGFTAQDARLRAEDAMERVGMAGAMHREMGGYSRGMRQRTKLAQGFAHEPDLLILDEPFNGLDPLGRHEMTELLKGWIREGRSVILASHILHEVELITPSFLLICGGRLLASGSADEVHTLLADIPNEIRIRCDNASALAQRLIEESVAESIRLDEGRQTVTLSTRTPLHLYTHLAYWLAESGIRVQELSSPDTSLQSLFNSLMRIHRGEL